MARGKARRMDGEEASRESAPQGSRGYPRAHDGADEGCWWLVDEEV